MIRSIPRPFSSSDTLPAALLLASLFVFWPGSPAVAEPLPTSLGGCAISENARVPRLGARPELGKPARPHWRKNLFKRIASDQKFLFTTWVPLELRRPEFIYPLAGATLAAASSSARRQGLDLRTTQYLEHFGSASEQTALEPITVLGDGATAAALIGGTYLVSRWTGHTRMARASSLSAEALLNTAIWSTVLKRVTRRARPSSRGEAGTFFVGDASIDATSFPSGHAMTAFAVAAVFAGEFRDKRWVPWVAYGTAGVIAASRVALGRHYVSDVVVGGMLGDSLGRMVVARERGTGARNDLFGRFQPIIDPGTQTYGLNYRHSW